MPDGEHSKRGNKNKVKEVAPSLSFQANSSLFSMALLVEGGRQPRKEVIGVGKKTERRPTRTTVKPGPKTVTVRSHKRSKPKAPKRK